jgi:hypothetical protein
MYSSHGSSMKDRIDDDHDHDHDHDDNGNGNGECSLRVSRAVSRSQTSGRAPGRVESPADGA